MPTVVAVQPSSLVFVAVVAIWAAWFVPHWIRRREHLSTARSLDRFSEAMRVVDREGAVPMRVRRHETVAVDTSLAGAAVGASLGSRVGSSVGSSLGSSLGSSPLHARTVGSFATAHRSSTVSTGRGRAAALTSEAVPSLLDGRAVASAARRPPRPARSRRSVLGRRIRGIVLLGALLAAPVLAVFGVLGHVPWWSIGLAAGVVVLSVFSLRLSAVREQTARRTAYAMRPRTGTPSPAPAGEVGEPTPSAAAEGEAPKATQPRVTAYRAGDPTWSPVPVPRPTYALKDPAPPREIQAPLPETDLDVDVAVAPTTSSPARRVAGG